MADPLENTLTRWREKATGRRLVAVAVKDDDGVRLVLPVHFYGHSVDAYLQPHPMDWLSEDAFLDFYEEVS